MRSLVSLVVVCLSACTYPNQFRNVPAGQPSASLSAYGVKIFRINDQPTSFWRTSENFTISPGKTSLKLVADREPYDYEPVTFLVMKGHRYHLQTSEDRSSVSLSDVTYEDGPRELADAKRLAD